LNEHRGETGLEALDGAGRKLRWLAMEVFLGKYNGNVMKASREDLFNNT